MENWQETILSQYGNSPVVQGLIAAFNDAIDPAALVDEFYDMVWNVATAQGYGLDVWGRIVDVSRILYVPGGGSYLGFQEAHEVTFTPFGQAPFWTGTQANTAFALSDSAYRLLILAKALANISRCSIPVINSVLRSLFPGRGNAYVSDTGHMIDQLTFEFALLPYEVSIVKASGVIPRPTGVRFNVMIVPLPPTPGGSGGTFGFKEAGYSACGYNQGTFFGGFA